MLGNCLCWQLKKDHVKPQQSRSLQQSAQTHPIYIPHPDILFVVVQFISLWLKDNYNNNTNNNKKKKEREKERKKEKDRTN